MEDLDVFFVAGDTRLLAITITDRRLIANAYRHKWEKVLDRAISPNQQGFVFGCNSNFRLITPLSILPMTVHHVE